MDDKHRDTRKSADDLKEQIRHLEARIQILEQSKNYYRAFFENGPYGAVILDPGTARPIEFNDQVCRQLGYTRDEFARLTLADIEASETDEEARAHIQTVIRKGSDSFDTLQRTKEGEIRNVRVLAQLIHVEDRMVYHCIWQDITVQKKAENFLSRSEQKWRNILVNTPQIGVSLDPSGTITFVNHFFLKLTGWEETEVTGADWFELFIPEQIRREVRNVFTTVMDQKDPYGFSSYENEILTRNGELRTIAWSNVLTKDVRGNVVDVTCLGIDLTERRKAEEKLRASEEKYRLLVENQSDMVVKVDTGGRFIFVSPSYCRTFGKTEDELIGRQFMPLVHEADRKATEAAMNKLYGPPYAAYVEQRAMTRNGWRWLAWVDTAVLDSQGHVREIIGVGRDITVQKNSEEALRQSENKFRSLFDLSPQAIALVDYKTGRIIDVNRKLCELTRYAKDDIIGTHTDQIGLFPLKDRDRLLAALHESGQVEDMEIDFRAKDGSHLSVRLFARMIEVAGERLILKILHDVTVQKELQTRLERAQKMESIGTLSGGIAHDFNNILAPIIGISELLMDDFPPASPEHDSVREILKAALRGSDLVKQILAFSRLSEHRLIPVRVQQILKEAVKLSRSTIPAYIDINYTIQQDCGLVMADPTQIHQVAMNLITNAFHALEPAGGTLSVALKEVELTRENPHSSGLAPGRYAEITVADTGSGIDATLMDKIFEPYFTTKEKGKGTGLGLSVVYGIVKEHRGDIDIHSEPGRGTVVRVCLPLMQESGRPVPDAVPPEIETGTERILLIDDEAAIVQIQKQMLERLGYTVTAFSDSREALHAFRAAGGDFDLVVTDMSMPRMTGDQLARELIAIRPDIPVIICTGFSERVNEESAAAMGIKGFLLKPVVRTELAQMVRQVLDEAGTA